MEKSKYIVLMTLWVVSFSLVAQTNRYMVFFTDKNDVPYSVDQPEAFLSEKAIARRQAIDFPVIEQDLPVDPMYLSGLQEAGAEVYFASRWFNAALVQMDESRYAEVLGLSYVDSINFIAKGIRFSTQQVEPVIPETFKDPESVEANSDLQLELLGVDHMHTDGYTGEGITIAVFDDGFLGVNAYEPFEHLFKENRLLDSEDFVKKSGNVYQYDDHGSASLSTIAADYNGFTGTAPDANYLLYVTEDISSEYRVEEYNWLLAAERADSAGADVISSSLGYSTFTDSTMNYTYEDLDGKTAVVTKAAALAVERGIIVVVSAGNEGNKKWRYVTTPADADGVLAVGSVTSSREKSGFSSVGFTADGRIKPDVVALGSKATVFFSGGNSSWIGTGSGTSFAAPQIAGFAAGIWQANPEWTGQEVVNAIKFSGHRSLNPDSLFGYGIPSYKLAVKAATLSVDDIINDRITVYPNPFKEDKIQISFGGMKLKSDLSISVLDMKGARIYVNEISRKDLPDHLEINLSSSQKGVYFLILEAKKFRKTVKLIRI